MSHYISLLLLLVPLAYATAQQGHQLLLQNAHRIVFLGDSITAAGQYVATFDAWLYSQVKQHPMVIDAGLPSETVSGLSEEGHAGGAFPRPSLDERLDRVLKLTTPDLVIACYGINCAIYQPFDDARFKRYQEGIIQLKSKVEKAGARFIAMTPPCFDDHRAARSFSYNSVLAKYAAWLVSQRKEGWHVIDLHTAMTAGLNRRRKNDLNFTFQPDAVHPNEAGHWFIAGQLIQWFGDEAAAQATSPQQMLQAKKLPPQLLNLTQQRLNILRDSYVQTAGHKRPGLAKGLPLPEALKKSEEITNNIEKLLNASPNRP